MKKLISFLVRLIKTNLAVSFFILGCLNTAVCVAKNGGHVHLGGFVAGDPARIAIIVEQGVFFEVEADLPNSGWQKPRRGHHGSFRVETQNISIITIRLEYQYNGSPHDSLILTHERYPDYTMQAYVGIEKNTTFKSEPLGASQVPGVGPIALQMPTLLVTQPFKIALHQWLPSLYGHKGILRFTTDIVQYNLGGQTSLPPGNYVGTVKIIAVSE